MYTLSTGGNLEEALPSLSAKLTTLRDKALGAAAAVKGGLTSAAASARAGLNSIAESAGQAAEGAGKVLAAMALLAYGTNAILKANDDWAQSVARLQKTLEDLGETVADTFGPDASKFIDDFNVGLAYLGDLAARGVGPALAGLRSILASFREMPEVKFLLKLAQGDLAGAFLEVVGEGEPPNLKPYVDQLIAAYKGLQDAHTDAMNHAYTVFKRIKDGVSDIEGKTKEVDTPLGKALDPVVDALLKLSFQIDRMPDIVQGLTDAVVPMQQIIQDLTIGLAAGAVNQANDALSGGLTGILEAFGGPLGSLVAAVLGLLKNLPDLAAGLMGEVIALVTDLPNQLGNLLGVVLPNIIAYGIPQLITGFVTLIPRLVLGIIGAIPALVGAMVNLIPQLLADLVIELKGLFSYVFGGQFFREMGEAVGAAVQQLVASLNVLGIGGGAQAQEHKFLGVKIPFFDKFQDSAGTVTRTGLAVVHRGEQISGRGGGGGVTIGAIHVHGVQDPRRFVEQLRNQLGAYGLGLSLDPRTP